MQHTYASCKTTLGKALVLEGMEAKGQVVGRMLDMTLEQRFRNPDSTNVEIIYTFPLPWSAVLLGMEIDLNGETLTGMVKAKSQARSEYEEALSEGNSSVLVNVNADRSYTLELGNLMAGETCAVRLHYVQTLQPEQGSLRLTLPTTIAPRYGDPVADGGFEPHAVPISSMVAEYPFAISLLVHGELVKAQVGSPSHHVSIRSIPSVGMKEGSVTEIHLAAKAWLDRDFILVFDQRPHASLGLAAWDKFDVGMGVVMASFKPLLPTRHTKPVTMKVLVDCSGSMAGASIQAARSALHSILDGLNENDRFSLSRFGSSVEHRSKALWKGAPAALAAAQRWAQQLEADLGGTEMEHAILSTLKLPGTSSSDIILITDGEIHAIDDVVETARQSGQRFFVVGIGASVAEGLLRRLAEATGGSGEFVSPAEPVEPAILRLYQRMRSAVVSHLRIEWPQGCGIHAASDVPKTAFDGDDITVFARLTTQTAESLCGQVRLFGHVEGVAEEVCIAEVQANFILDETNTLARLVVHQWYWQLKHSTQVVPATARRQLPALAEKYQLVTDDTGFLLVKKREEGMRAIDMPKIYQAENMMSAGWGGTGGMFAPAFWRKTPSSKARNVNRPSTGGMDDFEIPAFLRRQYEPLDDTPFDPMAGSTFQTPVLCAMFWLEEGNAQAAENTFWDNQKGLTPAGVSESLQLNPKSLWPESYQALRDIGLSDSVVDWLEFVVGAGREEVNVVQVFLLIISEIDFDLRQRALGTVTRWRQRHEEDVQASDKSRQKLVKLIRKTLSATKANEWPSEVVDFGEAPLVSEA